MDLEQIAARQGVNFHSLSPRDKVRFRVVQEYNNDRQDILDSDPHVTSLVGRVAENPTAEALAMLDEARARATSTMEPLEARIDAEVKALNLPSDPPYLRENHNNATLEVVFDDQVVHTETQRDLKSDYPAAKARIGAQMRKYEEEGKQSVSQVDSGDGGNEPEVAQTGA